MKENRTPKVLCLTFGVRFKVLVNMRERAGGSDDGEAPLGGFFV